MKIKLKLYGPIVILALLFYMTIATPHSRPLGDIVLESIELNSWTHGHQGFHIALIYYLILFIVVLVLSRNFSKLNQKDIGNIKLLLLYVL